MRSAAPAADVVPAGLLTGRRLVVAAGVSIGLVYLLVGLLLLHAVPILTGDSTGYIALARRIAGTPFPDHLEMGHYSPGYSLLLAPAAAVGASLHGILVWSVVVNAVLGTVLFLGLLRIVRAHVDGRLAVGVAAIGALVPGTVLQATFQWPEILLAALIAWWYGAVQDAAADRQRVRALAIAAVIAAVAYVVHPRSGPLLGATVLVVVVLLRSRPRVLLAVLAGTVAAGLIGYVAQGYGSNTFAGNGNTVGSLFRGLDMDLIRASGGVAAGELWAILVATAALPMLVVAQAVRGRRIDAGGLVLAALGTIVLGGFQLGQERVARVVSSDYLAYYRYPGIYVPTLLCLGLVVVLTAPRLDRITRWLPAASIAVTTAVVAALAGSFEIDGPPLSMNDLGYLGLEGSNFPGYHAPPTLDFLGPGLVSLAVALAVGVLTHRPSERSRLGVVGMTAAYVLVLLLLAFRSLIPWAEGFGEAEKTIAATATTLPAHSLLGLAPDAPQAAGAHAVNAAPSLELVHVTDRDLTRSGPAAVIGPAGWAPPRSAGMHLLAQSNDAVLWGR